MRAMFTYGSSNDGLGSFESGSANSMLVTIRSINDARNVKYRIVVLPWGGSLQAGYRLQRLNLGLKYRFGPEI
jgi:hypothetical protein